MSRPKRQPAFDARQIGFTFDAPVMPRRADDLAGLGRRVASAVALILKEEARPREVVAGAMSAMLGEDVTRWMLDGYASEARDKVNISVERFFALIAVTSRHDVLDSLTREIGAALLIGEEIHAARVGDLRCRIREMNAELKALEKRETRVGRAG